MAEMKNVYCKRKTIITITTLIAITVAGCSRQPSAPPNVAGSESKESAPTALTIVLDDQSGGNLDGEAVRYIEQKTNTKLKIIGIAPGSGGKDLENKLNVMLASGETPDIIQYLNDETEVKYVKSDILLPISDYFDKAPRLKASRTDEDWNAMRHPDGKIYAVGSRTPAVHFTNMYRKDWLDKLGLSVPSTLEEYYQVAEAISQKDPDGNGKKDTYAFGAPGTIGRYFDHIFGAFGILPNYWMLRDGKLVNGSVLPEAKEALKFLNKMYKGGMIDPEFITDNPDRNKNKFKAGIYGAQGNFIWIFDTNNINDYYKPFKEKNPNGEYVQGPVLKGPGPLPSVGMRKLSQRGVVKTSILKKSPNQAAALRLLDWIASEEGNLFVNYGLEGKHYKVGADGVITVKAEAKELKEYGVNQITLAKDALFRQTSPGFTKAKEATEKTALSNPVDGMLVAEIGKFEKELSSLTDTEYFKMIMGESPIDGGFEKYVNEWNMRGGKELAAALQKEYESRKK